MAVFLTIHYFTQNLKILDRDLKDIGPLFDSL